MRDAFTLLETVLVIVLIAIVSTVGINYLPVNHARDDAEYISMLVARTQYEGIGYDHRNFGGGEIASNRMVGCIDMNVSGFMSKESAGGGEYLIKSTLSGELFDRRVCFDHLGRPGFDDFSHPFVEKKSLNVKNGAFERNITIMPLSGFVIIAY